MSAAMTEVRLQPEVWELVDATAAQQGQTVSAYIDGMLRRLFPVMTAAKVLGSVEAAGIVRRVEIDPALIGQLLASAATVDGGTPSAIIADAVRRDVAGRLLGSVLDEIDSQGLDLDPDAADELVYGESRAARRARRR